MTYDICLITSFISTTSFFVIINKKVYIATKSKKVLNFCIKIRKITYKPLVQLLNSVNNPFCVKHYTEILFQKYERPTTSVRLANFPEARERQGPVSARNGNMERLQVHRGLRTQPASARRAQIVPRHVQSGVRGDVFRGNG